MIRIIQRRQQYLRTSHLLVYDGVVLFLLRLEFEIGLVDHPVERFNLGFLHMKVEDRVPSHPTHDTFIPSPKLMSFPNPNERGLSALD